MNLATESQACGMDPAGENSVSNTHDYCLTTPTGERSSHDTAMEGCEVFPPLPKAPSKPLAAKRKHVNGPGGADDIGTDIVERISLMFNARIDSLEKNVENKFLNVERLIADNTMKIEGLKKTVDFACAEIQDVKGQVTDVEKRVCTGEKKATLMEQRLLEVENYSRRWNLRLFGLGEKKGENIRREVIQICQSVLPEHKAKFPDVIDTVQRLGQLKENNTRPRAVILQFTLRVYRDAVWKAAKNSAFLQSKKLRFAEDLSRAVRERRMQLWPLVAKAREEGKTAYFVGGRAFAGGTELTLTAT